MITLDLPIPPTINHYYGRQGGKTFLGKLGKVFRHEVRVATLQHGRVQFGKARMAVKVVLHLPTRAGDIDNRLKPLLDAMEHACIYDNDRQVDDLRVIRGHPVKGGRCEVTLWEIE